MSIQCTICMSNVSPSETANAATCGHVFHEKCLEEWFLRSRTCPQCRALCYRRSIQCLYFSTMNHSTAVPAAFQMEFNALKLELTEKQILLDVQESQIKNLQNNQNRNTNTIIVLECVKERRLKQFQDTESEINHFKINLNLFKVLKKELEEKSAEFGDIAFSSTSVDEEELPKSEQSLKSLASTLIATKRKYNVVLNKRCEVKNTRNVCAAENRKLDAKRRNLLEKIKLLESENYKLKDDLSQLQKYSDEPKNCENKQNNTTEIESMPQAMASAGSSS